MNLFDLTNQTAAVIGGTGALGGAMALALAQHGAAVAVVGRNAKNGAERVREIENAGGQAQFFVADALDKGELIHARKAIESKMGAATILVNAAGGNKPEATLPPGADFCELPGDAWNDVFDLNLVGGALLPCQVWGETMVRNGEGSIINVASMAGLIPLSRVVAYGAAKAAVINLTHVSGARMGAKRRARQRVVARIFPRRTEQKIALQRRRFSYSERGGQIIGHTPMARFGSAEELAGAVVFLASSRASGFVTGQNLVVDGGFSSMTI